MWVGKGVLAPCPPSIQIMIWNGGHASLCPPYRFLHCRRMHDLLRSELPARTGNILWRSVDVLLKPHQLPVVRIVREGVGGFRCESDHGIVGTQGVAEQARGTERGGAAFQVLQESRSDAVALPAIMDRKTELETSGIGVERVAGFADDGIEAVNIHGGDDAEALIFADVTELVEQRFRQLAHGAKETIVAGARRERAEIVLHFLGVARLDKTNRHLLAVARAQHVGILP